MATRTLTPSQPFVDFQLVISSGTAYVIEADNDVAVSVRYGYQNIRELAIHVAYPVEYIAFNYFVLSRPNRGNVISVAATQDATRVSIRLSFSKI